MTDLSPQSAALSDRRAVSKTLPRIRPRTVILILPADPMNFIKFIGITLFRAFCGMCGYYPCIATKPILISRW